MAPGRGSRGLGALGVTDDRNRAFTHVGDALRDAPAGARGLVHKVIVSFSGLGYIYEGLVARGRLEPDSGTIVWETVPTPLQNTWDTWDPWESPQQPGPYAGDAFPPEAIAAGLADLKAEQGRRKWA